MVTIFPDDLAAAVLVGRMATPQGPIPIGIGDGRVTDLSGAADTVAELIESLPPGSPLPRGRDMGPVDALDLRPAWHPDGAGPLLAPIDLQCIKAAGVTFAASAIERVIEERARGNAAAARDLRATIQDSLRVDLAELRPGSAEAMRLKDLLIARGAWSQYLEVAIGPDAEIFTKAATLSAVGAGAYVGIRRDSAWNNPEPEIVLIGDAAGQPRGAALGNDVNLRDFEGRSALLLGKAKDNNAACAIGPFIRLFDAQFTLDDVRTAEVSLTVAGEDGFVLTGGSTMRLISRDPGDLLAQAAGVHHQYPDGLALFLGTMFAPVDDRDEPGRGFTHKPGDLVTVSSPRLGTLLNRVCYCDEAPPWTYGIAALLRDLRARRGRESETAMAAAGEQA